MQWFYDNIFQFHYGTIKSRHNQAVRKPRNVFQFHYGTIKRMPFR